MSEEKEQNSGHQAIYERGGKNIPRPPLQKDRSKSLQLTWAERAIQTKTKTIPGTDILTRLKHIVKHLKKDIVFLIRRKSSVQVKINFRPGDGPAKLILPESPGANSNSTDN